MIKTFTCSNEMDPKPRHSIFLKSMLMIRTKQTALVRVTIRAMRQPGTFRIDFHRLILTYKQKDKAPLIAPNGRNYQAIDKKSIVFGKIENASYKVKRRQKVNSKSLGSIIQSSTTLWTTKIRESKLIVKGGPGLETSLFLTLLKA